jgi:hypothetical protein
MNIVPRNIEDLLNFGDTHTSVFSSNAAALGLLPAQALAFKNAAGKARSDYAAALAADAIKKAAYNTSSDSIRAFRKVAADTVAMIKAFAENAANPSVVYSLAQLPMPATPQPAPPPGTPTDFTAGIDQTGAVMLKWKCPNPPGVSGTVYEVQRRIGEGAFGFLTVVGTRQFTDSTLPAGSSGVVYQITAMRSTTRGLPAQFNVNFGIGGGGLFVASATPVPMKMAA